VPGDAGEQAFDLGKLRGDRNLQALFRGSARAQLVDDGKVPGRQGGQDGGDVPLMALGLLDGGEQPLGHAVDGGDHDHGPPLR